MHNIKIDQKKIQNSFRSEKNKKEEDEETRKKSSYKKINSKDNKKWQ